MRPLILVCALAALCGIAVAQARDGAVSDRDDSRSLVDIASARATHDEGADRLVHVVRLHAPISPRNFRNAVEEHGPPGSVCVNLWTRRTPGEASPNFDVCVSGDRTRRNLVASVSRLGARGGVKRVGRATAELTRPRRLVIRFDPDLIKRPRSYRWSVQARTFERGCTRRGCADVAPNGARTVRAKLA